MNNETVDKSKNKHTLKEIVNSMEKLNELNKEIIQKFNINDILNLMNDSEKREEYIQEIYTKSEYCKQFALAVVELSMALGNRDLSVEQGMIDDKVIKNIKEDYRLLPDDKKKELCLELMNEQQFQRDLCDITIDAAVNAMPELKPLCKMFSVKKNLQRIYDEGRGYAVYDKEKLL